MEIDRDAIEAANDATYVAWNLHDPDAVAAVFAEDAELLDAFRDFHLERLHLLVDPPCNADRWRVTAVHTGDFMGLAPTGRNISVEGCTFSTFGPDGLVVRDVNFLDVASLLGQLSGE